ncbi:hypothetical protein AB0K00_21730 [Dactylosporangium sp. NPDC049525]|uniref:hypothetical protein n=1 Tax=Dactylosporangium sp. NPDC049525 TaxID=3154730 RepID=UPI003432F95A
MVICVDAVSSQSEGRAVIQSRFGTAHRGPKGTPLLLAERAPVARIGFRVDLPMATQLLIDGVAAACENALRAFGSAEYAYMVFIAEGRNFVFSMPCGLSVRRNFLGRALDRAPGRRFLCPAGFRFGGTLPFWHSC